MYVGNTWQFQDSKEYILILMKEILVTASNENWHNCSQLLHHHLSMSIARQWGVFLFVILYLNIVCPTIVVFPFVTIMALLIILLEVIHWTALDVGVNSPFRISEGIKKWSSALAKFTIWWSLVCGIWNVWRLGTYGKNNEPFHRAAEIF